MPSPTPRPEVRAPAARARSRRAPDRYQPRERVKDDFEDSSFSSADLDSDQLSEVTRSSSSAAGSTSLSGFVVASEGSPAGTNVSYVPSTSRGTEDDRAGSLVATEDEDDEASSGSA